MEKWLKGCKMTPNSISSHWHTSSGTEDSYKFNIQVDYFTHAQSSCCAQLWETLHNPSEGLRLNVELHVQEGVLQKLHIMVSPIKHFNGINL